MTASIITSSKLIILQIALEAYKIANVGTYDIEITVTDDNSVNAASGIESVTATFTLTIVGVNRIPIFDYQFSDLKLAVNETYFFS